MKQQGIARSSIRTLPPVPPPAPHAHLDVGRQVARGDQVHLLLPLGHLLALHTQRSCTGRQAGKQAGCWQADTQCTPSSASALQCYPSSNTSPPASFSASSMRSWRSAAICTLSCISAATRRCRTCTGGKQQQRGRHPPTDSGVGEDWRRRRRGRRTKEGGESSPQRGTACPAPAGAGSAPSGGHPKNRTRRGGPWPASAAGRKQEEPAVSTIRIQRARSPTVAHTG